MRNIALRLRYDGSAYHGWQSQKNAVTVADTLSRAIFKATGEERVKLVGCGRTDAGVHALTYCANFMTESRIPTDRIPLAINSRLPMDISVLKSTEVSEDFNSIGACLKKEYTYRIVNSRIHDPFLVNRACFFPSNLDVGEMERAGREFVGVHDFAAVRSVGTVTKTTVREVYWCDVSHCGELIEIKVCANGFLYNMARSIAGTIVYAGLGKIKSEDIPSLLETRDRRLTGPTMPPGGLYMSGLWYPGGVNGIFSDLPESLIADE